MSEENTRVEETRVEDQVNAGNEPVDFDALTRPEGEEAIPELSMKDLGVETPEPAASEQTVAETSKPDDSDVPNDSVDSNQGYKAVFDRYKEILGENYQVPEDINEENLIEHLNDAALRSIKWENVLDPRIIQMQQLLDQGAKFEDIVRPPEQTSQMTGDALLRAYYQDKYGVGEDTVQEYVDEIPNKKLTELEARKYFSDKEAYQSRIQIEENNRLQQQQQAEQQAALEAEIKATVGNFDKIDEIYGAPVDAKHKQEFEQVFRKWVTPDSKGGPSPLSQLLSDNDFLAKIVYLAEYQDGPVRKAIFKAKDGVKEEMQKRLDIQPKMVQSSTAKRREELDYDALSRPALD